MKIVTRVKITGEICIAFTSLAGGEVAVIMEKEDRLTVNSSLRNNYTVATGALSVGADTASYLIQNGYAEPC